MRAVRLTSFGIENTTVDEVPDPVASPGRCSWRPRRRPSTPRTSRWPAVLRLTPPETRQAGSAEAMRPWNSWGRPPCGTRCGPPAFTESSASPGRSPPVHGARLLPRGLHPARCAAHRLYLLPSRPVAGLPGLPGLVHLRRRHLGQPPPALQQDRPWGCRAVVAHVSLGSARARTSCSSIQAASRASSCSQILTGSQPAAAS